MGGEGMAGDCSRPAVATPPLPPPWGTGLSRGVLPTPHPHALHSARCSLLSGEASAPRLSFPASELLGLLRALREAPCLAHSHPGTPWTLPQFPPSSVSRRDPAERGAAQHDRGRHRLCTGRRRAVAREASRGRGPGWGRRRSPTGLPGLPHMPRALPSHGEGGIGCCSPPAFRWLRAGTVIPWPLRVQRSPVTERL